MIQGHLPEITFVKILNGKGSSLSTEFQFSKSSECTKNKLIIAMMWITFTVSPCQCSFDICVPSFYYPLILVAVLSFCCCSCLFLFVRCSLPIFWSLFMENTNCVFFLHTLLQLPFLEPPMTMLFKVSKS